MLHELLPLRAPDLARAEVLAQAAGPHGSMAWVGRQENCQHVCQPCGKGGVLHRRR